MKKTITMAIAVMFAIALAACTGKKSANEADSESNVKRLVLYYSQTGTTKTVAEALQKELGADIEAIEVEEFYSGTYDETIARVMKEREQGITPKVKPLQHNPQDYDVVFLGYPIWFGTYAPPIAGLLEAQDFEGVKIVPFCTFGSGGLEVSVKDLKVKLTESEIVEGYGVRTARIEKMPNELHRFLVENGYVEGEVETLPEFTEQQPVTDEQTAIFDAACGNYQFPLGTPVTYSQRTTPDGKEYRFSVKSQSPDGSEATSTIFVIDNGETQEFTKVVLRY